MLLKRSKAVGSRKMMALGVGLLIGAGVLALGVAGCSGSTTSDTTAATAVTGTTAAANATGGTAASSATSATTSTTIRRMVVGGKTTEEYEKSLPGLAKSAEANPKDLTVLQNLAVAQYNTGKFDEAAATYEKMLKLKDDPMTHNNYGNVLRDAKKLADAEAQYKKAIEGNKSLAVAYVNLASVLASQSKIDEALSYVDKGIAATTGDDQTRLKDYKSKLEAVKK